LQRIAVPSARGGEGGSYELAVAVKVHGRWGLGTALSTALSIEAHAIESTQHASRIIAALLDGYEAARNNKI
jgi:hypothetical protein